MSWLDRNESFQLNDQNEWPLSSKCMNHGVSDAEVSALLLERDTDFSQGLCELQFLTSNQSTITAHSCHTQFDDDQVLQEHVQSADWIVVSVGQQRYFGNETKVHLNLDRQRWLNLLNKLEIPGTAIELLHDNNGGHGAFYSTDQGPQANTTPGASGRSQYPEAFHIFVNPSNCRNSENFLYAHHNYRTGQKVVLHAGTECDHILHKIKTRLQFYPHSNIFHALLAALSVCYYVTERLRWQVDEAVQETDVQMPQSGFAQVAFNDDIPDLDSTKLSLEEGIAWPRNAVQMCITSVKALDRILIFVEQQLWRYARFEDGLNIDTRPMQQQIPLENLSSAFLLKSSQCQAQITQMEGLKTRIDTQFNMITALVAQRDSATNVEIARAMQADGKINIGIAKAMQKDSKLMRGIAFVTMTFLPATTFATFFSMDFFNVSFPDATQNSASDSVFVVSKWLWVYFVCTVPLTIMLTWEYGLGQWLILNFCARLPSKHEPSLPPGESPRTAYGRQQPNNLSNEVVRKERGAPYGISECAV